MTCSVWCSCCYIPIATVDAPVCAHAQYCTGGSRSAAAFCEDSSVDGVTDMAVSACNSLIATTALDSLNSQSKNWREKMGGKQLLKVKPPECTITKWNWFIRPFEIEQTLVSLHEVPQTIWMLSSNKKTLTNTVLCISLRAKEVSVLAVYVVFVLFQMDG